MAPAEGETLPLLAKLGTSARFGSVAVPVPDAMRAGFAAALSPDGRVNLEIVDPGKDPYLTRILLGLRRRTGCSALAVLPLGLGREPAVAVPGDALRLWSHGGLAALQLGPFVVRR